MSEGGRRECAETRDLRSPAQKAEDPDGCPRSVPTVDREIRAGSWPSLEEGPVPLRGHTRRLSGVMRRRTRFSGTCVGRGRPRPFSNAPLPRLWRPVRLSAVTFAGATPPVPPTTLTLLISSPVSSHAHRVGDPPFSLFCFILLVHLRLIASFLSF